MTDVKPRVVAVIPCYNTASHIAEVVTKTLPYVDQVIVVDDGSTDDTAEVARKAGALVFSHDKNLGKGAAMKYGAQQANADILVFLDGDGQHDSSEIPKVTEPIILKGFDAVIGSRHFQGSTITSSLLRRRWANILASVVIFIFTNIFLPLISLPKLRIHIGSLRAKVRKSFAPNQGLKSKKIITDCTSGFRAIRNKRWQELDLISNGFQIETEMIYESRKHKLILTEVPISCNWNGNISNLSIAKDGYRTLKLLFKKLAYDFRKI